MVNTRHIACRFPPSRAFSPKHQARCSVAEHFHGDVHGVAMRSAHQGGWQTGLQRCLKPPLTGCPACFVALVCHRCLGTAGDAWTYCWQCCNQRWRSATWLGQSIEAAWGADTSKHDYCHVLLISGASSLSQPLNSKVMPGMRLQNNNIRQPRLSVRPATRYSLNQTQPVFFL